MRPMQKRTLTIAATGATRMVWVGPAAGSNGGYLAGIVSPDCAYSVYMVHTGYRAPA